MNPKISTMNAEGLIYYLGLLSVKSYGYCIFPLLIEKLSRYIIVISLKEMVLIIEILKVILLGIVEGITEWLPISSTGHMILVDEFMKLNMSAKFMEMFLVVIQLGAILAVVVLYWNRLIPWKKEGKSYRLDQNKMIMWGKILVACIPAAIIGLLFDDFINEHLYNYFVVAIALIVFGIAFIWIEDKHKGKRSRVHSIEEISYKDALWVGVFQVIAAVFPGTSRSGATILGGIWVGLSRVVATEFTFFLAIPIMFGASLLKLVKFGFNFTFYEFFVLLLGMAVSFIVSIFAIKFLLSYIKKNSFKVFGWYRIVLGIIVLIYFNLIR